MTRGRKSDLAALERKLEEQERSASLVAALDEAARAIGDGLQFDELFAAVGETLRPLGIVAHVLLVDGDELTIDYIGAFPEVLHRAEEAAGISARDYRLPLARSPFHRQILASRSAVFTDDVVSVVRAGIPPALAPVAPILSRVLRMKQMIGAPLESHDARGVLVLSSEKLTAADTSAVSVLAQHLSAAMRKVELVSQLQESVEALSAAQDQLVQSQKMEALGQLAGGVAHDLNNILTAVGVAAEFLGEVVPPDGREDLATIVDGTERAAALVRQLLAFGRRQLLRRRLADLNAVVTGLQPLLERLVGEDMSLEYRLCPDPWGADIDTRQLEQVLLNLVVNARDASSVGGRIVVETSNVSADATPPGLPALDAVCLCVSDRGTGMDEATRARIFDPFFTTKPAGQGTGLGLSVSYGIVRQHDGWMRVESRPGEGTSIWLLVPAVTRVRVEGIVEPVTAEKRGSTPSLRVLLVEDDPGVRRALSAVLRRAGHDVLEADTIATARKLLDGGELRVDAVITDVVLPDGSGPELASRLCEESGAPAVVVMTGYADEEAKRALSALSRMLGRRVPLLLKPFKPDELLSELVQAVG